MTNRITQLEKKIKNLAFPRKKSQQYEDYILYGDKEKDDEEDAREHLNKLKSRVAKDNYIRKMIKKGIYL